METIDSALVMPVQYRGPRGPAVSTQVGSTEDAGCQMPAVILSMSPTDHHSSPVTG